MKCRVSQMESLKDVLSNGLSYTMDELVKLVGLATGRAPTVGSINVLLSHLRTRHGYAIGLNRGTGGAKSTYKLAKGSAGIKRKRKAA